MKKNITFIAIIAGIVTICVGYKPIKETYFEKPVAKEISFEMYKGASYNSEAYNNTSATVHVVIEKVRKNKRIKVWDTTFEAKNLKQYPSAENAINKSVVIPGIFDKKEHLEVRYILTYNSRGSELQMQDETLVKTGEETRKVAISI